MSTTTESADGDVQDSEPEHKHESHDVTVDSKGNPLVHDVANAICFYDTIERVRGQKTDSDEEIYIYFGDTGIAYRVLDDLRDAGFEVDYISKDGRYFCVVPVEDDTGDETPRVNVSNTGIHG